jgi:omega-amidase
MQLEDLQISLIQCPLIWENPAANREALAGKIESLKDADIILLPEMFTTGFTMNAGPMAETMDGPTVAWMKEMSQRKNCFIAGSFIAEEGGRYYNRLVWASAEEVLTYDKRHLFSLAGEQKTFSPGRRKIIPTVKGWKICPLICYDLRFPVWSRRTPSADYDVLLFVANWPERRLHAWKQLLIARAIENQCYVAGVNRIGPDGNDIQYSGDSAVIDYKGDCMITSRQEEVLHCTLNYEALALFRRQYAFFRDGDAFELSL